MVFIAPFSHSRSQWLDFVKETETSRNITNHEIPWNINLEHAKSNAKLGTLWRLCDVKRVDVNGPKFEGSKTLPTTVLQRRLVMMVMNESSWKMLQQSSNWDPEMGSSISLPLYMGSFRYDRSSNIFVLAKLSLKAKIKIHEKRWFFSCQAFRHCQLFAGHQISSVLEAQFLGSFGSFTSH